MNVSWTADLFRSSNLTNRNDLRRSELQEYVNDVFSESQNMFEEWDKDATAALLQEKLRCWFCSNKDEIEMREFLTLYKIWRLL